MLYGGKGMIELNTLQTFTMRGIHLFGCQAGNLEAAGAFPAPSLPLTDREPGYRHIHQHMFLDTFQEQRQHIQITQSIPPTPCLKFRVLGRKMSWVRADQAHVFVCRRDIYVGSGPSFVLVSFNIFLTCLYFWSNVPVKKMKWSLLVTVCYHCLRTTTHCQENVVKPILWFWKGQTNRSNLSLETASSTLNCTIEYIQHNLDVHGSKIKGSWSLLSVYCSCSPPPVCLLFLFCLAAVRLIVSHHR